MWDDAIYLRNRLQKLARAELREEQMFVCMAIDKCLDLLYFVVRQCGIADDITSNLPRSAGSMHRRSHIKHGHCRSILRTWGLCKSRVTDEIRLSTILADDIEASNRQRRRSYAITGHGRLPFADQVGIKT